MKKKRNRLFIFLSVVLVILVVFVLVIASLFISRESVSFEADKMDYVAFVSANRKLQEEFKYITTSDINNTPRKVVFSSSEVNALLAMVSSGTRMLNGKNIVFSDILLGFNQGVFYFDFSKRISFYTPFGRYINLRSKLFFDIENNDFKIDILSFKVGYILVPKFLVDYFLEQKQRDIRAIPLIHKLLLAVKEIHVYKSKLVILYYPKNLRDEFYGLMHGFNQLYR